MNIAIINKNLHPFDKERFELISDYYECEIQNKFSSNDLYNKDINTLIISDLIKTSYLLKILFLLSKKKINKKILINQELYLIEKESFINEFLRFKYILSLAFLKNFFSTFSFFINMLIFKFIIKKFSFNIITTSSLRKKYLGKYYKASNIYYLRNYPLKKNIENNKITLKNLGSSLIYEIIKSNNYLLIGGRINNLIDFNKICEYCYKNNLNIIIANNQKKILTNLSSNYKNIYHIGTVKNDIVIELIKNCLAGVCLYRSDTINQSMSSSIKFLELLCLTKNVIISNNSGLLNEINNQNKNLIFNINQINSWPKLKYQKYIFNYEYILDITNIESKLVLI